MRAPLAFVAVAFGAGIGLAWWIQPPLFGMTALMGAAALLYLWAGSRPAVSNLCLLGLGLLFGMLLSALDARVPPDSIAGSLTENPQPVACQGRVASDVEWVKPSYGQAQLEGWLSMTHILHRSGWVTSGGRVRLRLAPRAISLAYGDRVLIHGEVRGPQRRERSDPAGQVFNEGQWLWLRGACGVLTVSDPEGITKLSTEKGPWVRYRRWVARFRRELKALGRSLVGPHEAAYLEALLLGEGQGISKELEEAFRKTGTIHVLVVSGFQVGLMGVIGLTALSFLRVPRGTRYLFVAAGLILYCTLTGANPPILRATVMGLILFYGLYLGEAVSSLNLLGGAALLILLWNPRALADASFQLSFAAVFGMVTVAPWLEEKIHLPKAIAASLGAWSAVSPFIAWHFRWVTPIALIANLIIIPWTSILVGTGALLYTLGLIHPMLALPCAASFQFLSNGLTRAVEWMAGLPGASWSW